MEIRPFLDNLSDFGNKAQLEVILDTPHHKDICIMLPKDQMIKEHRSKFPITVHVLSGKILFTVGEKKFTLKAGDLIALEPNVMHELLAYEDSVARLTMFKVT
jgi:quercetin dioxygenase-like cupin family protein